MQHLLHDATSEASLSQKQRQTAALIVSKTRKHVRNNQQLYATLWKLHYMVSKNNKENGK